MARRVVRRRPLLAARAPPRAPRRDRVPAGGGARRAPGRHRQRPRPRAPHTGSPRAAGLPLITRNRFTRHDGPMSVQRSYTRVELRALLAGANLRPVGGGRRAVRAPGRDRGRVDARVRAARTAARGATARGTRAAAARMTGGRRASSTSRSSAAGSRARRPPPTSRGPATRWSCSSARRRGAGGRAACSPPRRPCASCGGPGSMRRRSTGSRGPSRRCAWSRRAGRRSG